VKFKIKTEQDRRKVISIINNLDLNKKSYKGEVSPVTNLRSINQNNYYWLLLSLISVHTGYSSDELHKIFKQKFLSSVEIKALGEEIIHTGTTTDKKTVEFINYLDRIKMFAAQDLDIVLPDPKETL